MRSENISNQGSCCSILLTSLQGIGGLLPIAEDQTGSHLLFPTTDKAKQHRRMVLVIMFTQRVQDVAVLRAEH